MLFTLPKLYHLGLSDNGLSGSLPVEIKEAVAFSSLDLSNNRLSGVLPPELCELVQLNSLNLRNNRFSGALPAEIGKMTELSSLDLTSNKFSGPLPKGDRSVDSLDVFVTFRKRIFRRVAGDAGESGKFEKFLRENESFVGAVPGGVNEVG